MRRPGNAVAENRLGESKDESAGVSQSQQPTAAIVADRAPNKSYPLKSSRIARVRKVAATVASLTLLGAVFLSKTRGEVGTEALSILEKRCLQCHSAQVMMSGL